MLFSPNRHLAKECKANVPLLMFRAPPSSVEPPGAVKPSLQQWGRPAPAAQPILIGSTQHHLHYATSLHSPELYVLEAGNYFLWSFHNFALPCNFT